MSSKDNILAQLNRGGKEIYTFTEIRNIVNDLSQGTVRKVLSELSKENRLIRLKREVYLYVPEGYQENWTASNFWIGANLVQPYAVSFWSALNHWGLTEQLPKRTYIQTNKGIVNYSKNILGSEYQFIRLNPKRFFGITQIWVANHQVNITDQEKTLVDCLAFPAYCGGISEVIKGLYNFYQTNQSKNLIDYANKMGQPVLKRLGYLLEILEVSNKEELDKIKSFITNPNPVVLEPLLPAENSQWNSKWKLNLNIVKEDLLNWKTT